ncbi:hypothetical protein SAMN03159341_110139 [Paenibacillus sp. 1_12]|uniref:COG1470 family protein n=1 Tax=Paenibacillus sp. 1_12 TaxID=1566278 RepID=UPI0008E169F3|nr:hypothetical protein [Paenibacillus sp. 1_12]SFL83019.1 hypothetical protein SAMN03159341_110139 [Paenibacillus sp. 1_12]
MFRLNMITRLLLIVLTLAAIWQIPIQPVMAEGESYQREELDSSLQLPAVAIGSNSSIQLKSAAVVPTDGGRMLFFTMTVTNAGSGKLSFLDYWVKVISISGAEFKADLVTQDKLKKEIPAGQQVEFSFYAPVNDSVQLYELGFRITKWDYSSADLEKTVGDIRFPDAAEALWAPVSGGKTVQLSAMPVELDVTAWSALAGDSYMSPKLTLRLTNKGKTTIRINGYQYALRTSSGAMYPLDIVLNADKQSLQPDVPLELQLRANQLPLSAGTDSWDLVMTQPFALTTDTKISFPIASLRISTDPKALPELGGVVSYTNTDGTYSLKAEKIGRLPWEDQDILSAEVSLTHNQSVALPFPELKAYFELDGGSKVDAKVIKLDRSVGVPPSEPVHVKLVAKIPYTYPFSSVKLVVQEKKSETATEEIAQFQLPELMISMPLLTFGQTQSITGAGRATSFSPREINTYTDGASNLFEVQVEVSNLEKRSNIIPKLTAFFKTANDDLYPTKIREVKQKLNPQGKALLSFSTKLPKDLDVQSLRLVIGESITEQRLSGTDDKAEAYINAVQMELPLENTTVSPILKELVFYPYTISLSNINTWLDRNTLRINFKYKLTKDSFYETSTEGSKLIIQFVDSNGKVNIDEVFYLETAPEEEDKRLKLGEFDYRITKQDDSLIFKIESLKKYKMNIYHEFQGKRKLLGSQTMDWFGTTE